MGVVGQPSVESGVKWEGESLRQKDLKQQAWETWGVEEQQAAKSGGTWEGKLCSQGKPLHLSGGTEGEEEQQDESVAMWGVKPSGKQRGHRVEETWGAVE